MRFKPAKSKSLVIKRGVVVDRFRFAIAGTIIPTLREKLVKGLGRLYNCSMKDTVAIQNTTRDLYSWLTCDNTLFCSSLHKLLSPRRELMWGQIKREAGSKRKEQKHNNL